MHIVMVSAEYPPRWGGMGSTVHHLSTHLAEKGHRVSVITRSNRKKHTNNHPNLHVFEVKWAKIPMHFTRSFAHYSVNKLESIAANHRIDLIHLHLPMVSLTRKQMMKCNSIAPTLASLHGSWLGERDGLIAARRFGEAAVLRNPNDLSILLSAKYYSKFEKISAQLANVSVANSNATRIEFVERYHMPEDWRCETIYWGVDTELFSPVEDPVSRRNIRDKIRHRYGFPQESPLVLAVGRLAARKGYKTLLKSFKHVIQEVPGAKLLIIGRGGMKKKLKRYAKKNGFQSSIKIESSLDFDELSEAYSSCDLTVFPSYYEGQGLIPLEAMSSGIPVIATDCGPIPEMVDDTVGSLFQMGDDEDLARSIIDELKDPQRLSEKGRIGRKRVIQNFSLIESCEKFLGLYESLSTNFNDQS